MGNFALRFISGKYQGGEIPLRDDCEMVIGRGADLDLVLAEDMVSRKHAKLIVEGGNLLSILDLGSTNGTFVNGEKIRRATLNPNDRVLIGTSIIKIILAKEMRQRIETGAVKRIMEDLAARAPSELSMSGDLEEVPLPDLLQLFGTNKKSGVLTISGAHRGKLYITSGQLIFAMVDKDPTIKPMKALCRMMSWREGTFQMKNDSGSHNFTETFEESTESLLMEALRQHDELQQMMSELPSLSTRLAMCVPMTPRLTDLSPSELDTLQLVINFGSFETVIDKSPGTDHQAVKNISNLIKSGYLEPE